ncbi:Nucleoside:proton symporter NupC [Candidatus Bealeia paramacronuclearis]|uniref:Nucleoside:proton symporter NupC n=1 Tax=Candidatus Bealeia paramacronuclearis TaxID=1921001 RepID=A0ABZ2C216_9PROT|nr:Nucleoside:proton symporter NupC [Candidatus Bealeia paramacronuclearis]
MLIPQALLGIVTFIAVAWIFSESRKNVNFKQVIIGLLIQFLLAVLVLKIDAVRNGFLFVGDGVMALKDATVAGTSFVFGYLGGGDSPFSAKDGANTFIFAFQALPVVIVVSAIAMLLFHWQILPVLVKFFSKGFQKVMGIGGALGVCAAAKMFLGQTEAPLLIRPYLGKFTRSELFTVMVAGMATTSISIMVLYGMILEKVIMNPIAHILTASVISVPAAITISRILIPQVGEETSGHLVVPYKFSGSMDAISQGTSDGMRLFMNILAMLIVFLSLVALTNAILGLFPGIGGEPMSLQLLLGYALSPLAWLMGIPWDEALIAGGLLGKKTILNEIVAFISLASIPQGIFSAKTSLIMTYALCGFANLSSIGIQIGGIGTMVPERRQEIISLGLKAMIAGTVASCMSGAMIGIITSFG